MGFRGNSTYTAPYASIDVSIFFHKDISGINDVKSLRGFTIGVKAGDACIDFLKKKGISTLQEFPSYESIIRSAMEQKVKVFCIDAPPALYYLYKMNLEKNYRHTEPLYTGQFHRAVPKDRKDLLAVVESGFAGISQKEYEEIRKRWLGAPIPMTHYLAYIFYLMGAFVLSGGILLLWNYTLRRKVTQKTVQLSETINALQKSEEKYRLVVENADEAIRMAGPIHDIGKLSIPAEILSKPGKLSEIEFSLIKGHSQSGYEILKDVESPWPLAQIVYQHHTAMMNQ